MTNYQTVFRGGAGQAIYELSELVRTQTDGLSIPPQPFPSLVSRQRPAQSCSDMIFQIAAQDLIECNRRIFSRTSALSVPFAVAVLARVQFPFF